MTTSCLKKTILFSLMILTASDVHAVEKPDLPVEEQKVSQSLQSEKTPTDIELAIEKLNRTVEKLNAAAQFANSAVEQAKTEANDGYHVRIGSLEVTVTKDNEYYIMLSVITALCMEFLKIYDENPKVAATKAWGDVRDKSVSVFRSVGIMSKPKARWWHVW